MSNRLAGSLADSASSLGTALVLVTYVTPMATVPATAADLGAGPGARAWILSSMSVGLAAALLATGRARRHLRPPPGVRRRPGRARSSARSSARWRRSRWLFVGARVVEGIGGAAVLACGLAVLAHDFAPGPARVHATSVWGASVGLGITAGALLAAALDVGSGWRETYAVAGRARRSLLLLPSLARIGESVGRGAAPDRRARPGAARGDR